jgi:hypothetical protein
MNRLMARAAPVCDLEPATDFVTAPTSASRSQHLAARLFQVTRVCVSTSRTPRRKRDAACSASTCASGKAFESR